MDTILLNTFLEVVATRSFHAASERLFVTQSAVSLRIQRLEEEVGQTLFVRSKTGTELTPAGRNFEPFAHGMLRLWGEARQRVSVTEVFHRSLTVGAEPSLWPRLGFRWFDALRSVHPDISLRAEVGMTERLTRFLVEGSVEVALLYTPQLRPNLRGEAILNEELVLVATWADPELDRIGDRYILVDWGPEFLRAHATDLPQLRCTGVTLSLGAQATDYLRSRDAAAYLPARTVKADIDSGLLHLVPDAPKFPFPIWAVWRTDLEPVFAASAASLLRDVSRDLGLMNEEVISALTALSEVDKIADLGQRQETVE